MSCRNECNSELVPGRTVSLTPRPCCDGSPSCRVHSTNRLRYHPISPTATPLAPVLTTANARRQHGRVSSPADGGGARDLRFKNTTLVSKSWSERVCAYYTYNTYYTCARIFIWTHKCAVEFIACTPPAFSRRVPKWIRRLPRDLP